jgi:excisionase family DNA binding protein
MTSPDDLLSPDDIAALLQNRVTIRAVQKWCKSGRLRAINTGRKWLIRRADFEAFLRAHEGGNRGKTNALAA